MNYTSHKFQFSESGKNKTLEHKTVRSFLTFAKGLSHILLCNFSASAFFIYTGKGLFSRIITPTFSNLVIFYTCPPMNMEQTECSETSAYKIQTPGNYPEESI